MLGEVKEKVGPCELSPYLDWNSFHSKGVCQTFCPESFLFGGHTEKGGGETK